MSLPPGRSALAARVRRLCFSLRRHAIARRLYLAWLNHVQGGVSMNMIATKPARYVGRHEGVWVGERALRTIAAGARLPLDRRRRRAPARLPRTPEQAAAALREDAPRDSRQPAAPSG